MDDFSQYPIINIDDGLARVANKKALYARLLGTFINNPRENEIMGAVENKDLEAAVMAAHTVKGVAANLSLSRLQKYTEHLEHMFKDAKDAGDASVFEQVDTAAISAVFSETVTEVAGVVETFKQV